MKIGSYLTLLFRHRSALLGASILVCLIGTAHAEKSRKTADELYISQIDIESSLEGYPITVQGVGNFRILEVIQLVAPDRKCRVERKSLERGIANLVASGEWDPKTEGTTTHKYSSSGGGTCSGTGTKCKIVIVWDPDDPCLPGYSCPLDD